LESQSVLKFVFVDDYGFGISSTDPCPQLYLTKYTLLCRYVAEPCPDYANKEFCDLGEDCPFAHGTFEINLHPSKYCTKVGLLAQFSSRPIGSSASVIIPLCRGKSNFISQFA